MQPLPESFTRQQFADALDELRRQRDAEIARLRYHLGRVERLMEEGELVAHAHSDWELKALFRQAKAEAIQGLNPPPAAA